MSSPCSRPWPRWGPLRPGPIARAARRCLGHPCVPGNCFNRQRLPLGPASEASSNESSPAAASAHPTRPQAGHPLAVLAPPGAAPLLWASELLVAPLAAKLGQLFDNAAPAGDARGRRARARPGHTCLSACPPAGVRPPACLPSVCSVPPLHAPRPASSVSHKAARAARGGRQACRAGTPLVQRARGRANFSATRAPPFTLRLRTPSFAPPPCQAA
jgi:hypothetical protein